MAVYFITSRDYPAVKIGHTSNLATRVQGIRASVPFSVELAAHDDAGDLLTEAEVLFRLHEHRIKNDWFRSTPGVLRLVAKVNERGHVPGGWHLPEVARGNYQRCQRQTICSRYNLTVEDYARLTATAAPKNKGVPDYTVAIHHIPILMAYINRDGPVVSAADFWEPVRTLAVARAEQAAA